MTDFSHVFDSRDRVNLSALQRELLVAAADVVHAVHASNGGMGGGSARTAATAARAKDAFTARLQQTPAHQVAGLIAYLDDQRRASV